VFKSLGRDVDELADVREDRSLAGCGQVTVVAVDRHVTVPSAFGSTTKGPASTVVSDLPLAGLCR
jgi:hypothetical protein